MFPCVNRTSVCSTDDRRPIYALSTLSHPIAGLVSNEYTYEALYKRLRRSSVTVLVLKVY